MSHTACFSVPRNRLACWATNGSIDSFPVTQALPQGPQVFSRARNPVRQEKLDQPLESADHARDRAQALQIPRV